MSTNIVIDLMRATAPAEMSLKLDPAQANVIDQYADALLDDVVLAMRIGVDVQKDDGTRRADLNKAVFEIAYGVVVGNVMTGRVEKLAGDEATRMRMLQNAVREAALHSADDPLYLITVSVDALSTPSVGTGTYSGLRRGGVVAEPGARLPDSGYLAQPLGSLASGALLAMPGVATSTFQPDASHELAAGAVLTAVQRDARQRRNEIFAEDEWLTAGEVEQRVRDTTTDSNPSQFASRLRRERRLFGVRYRGQYLHPAFQFDPNTGQLLMGLPCVLRWLPEEPDGWAAAFWFYQPSLHLGGDKPARVLARDPIAVARAAEKDFRRTDDEW